MENVHVLTACLASGRSPAVMCRLGGRWVIAILLFMLLLTACAAESPQLSDGDVVFCLSDAERAALAQAAVTLGLADAGRSPEEVTVAGKPLAVGKWRVEHP